MRSEFVLLRTLVLLVHPIKHVFILRIDVPPITDSLVDELSQTAVEYEPANLECRSEQVIVRSKRLKRNVNSFNTLESL